MHVQRAARRCIEKLPLQKLPVIKRKHKFRRLALYLLNECRGVCVIGKRHLEPALSRNRLDVEKRGLFGPLPVRYNERHFDAGGNEHVQTSRTHIAVCEHNCPCHLTASTRAGADVVEASACMTSCTRYCGRARTCS